MAAAFVRDDNLQADTRNEKWSLAYLMLHRMEKAASESGSGKNFPREQLAKQFSPSFKGQNRQSKISNALTAINRALRAYEDYKRRNPYDLCGLDDFLKRYSVALDEPVPFSKGVQIITAQEKAKNLARARIKFDQLIAKITEAPRKPIDPDSIEIQRTVRPWHEEKEDCEGHLGKFYDLASPKEYPKMDEEIPDDFFFHAKDVWELWKKASELKITRPHRKFF